jgi:MFS family permease
VKAVFATRGLRGVADGLMSASLSVLLLERGFAKGTVGIISTATLLGSAASLLLIARFAGSLTPYRVLLAMSALMVITGLTFGLSASLPLLLLVSAIGPLNPSSGDVSAFLPAEQTVVGSSVSAADRTEALATFSLVALSGASLGAFLAGPVSSLGKRIGFADTNGVALTALVYAAVGAIVIPIYVVSVGRSTARSVTSPSRLGQSRKIIRELTALFALDSAGGGMVVYSIIALWLRGRFDFSLGRIGAVFGFMSLASALSARLAARLSTRYGLVQTMVFTHLPANLLLMAAAFAPSASLAVGLLIARSLLSQMDVPPRVSFVMSLVTPAERSAASAFTNLPRSIATASTPLLAAWMLQHSTFGWPLVAGGLVKIVYDVLLWQRFRHRQIASASVTEPLPNGDRSPIAVNGNG